MAAPRSRTRRAARSRARGRVARARAEPCPRCFGAPIAPAGTRRPTRPRSPAPPRRRRRPSIASGSSPFAKRVAHAADSMDEPRVAQLAPEVADIDLQRVRARTEVVPPDAVEDQRPGEYLARVPKEELEQ